MPKLGETIGRYTIESRLGQGGMAEVFRAFDEQLCRPVALKVLLARDLEGDASLREWTARMLREARAVAAFNHPNAVAVYDVGEHDGLPFIVMELVSGGTLLATVGDARVPLAERVRRLADAARALGAAHRAGLVHRDVKPENVMVRDDGVVKILDFGIARRTTQPVDPTEPTGRGGLGTLTENGAIIGTPAYMAPEQLQRQPLDGRTDQFSWGVMAYQLLADRLPWDAADPFALAGSIIADDPPSLRAHRPEISERLEAAVRRALAKRPEDRFASMEEAAAALEAAAAPAPASLVAAASPRRTLLLLALTLVALVLVTGAWILSRARADRALPRPSRTESTPQ